MKKAITLSTVLLLAACAASPREPGLGRNQIRDCPPGMVLICESSRDQEPSSGGDEEIPLYDRCYCEDAGLN